MFEPAWDIPSAAPSFPALSSPLPHNQGGNIRCCDDSPEHANNTARECRSPSHRKRCTIEVFGAEGGI